MNERLQSQVRPAQKSSSFAPSRPGLLQRKKCACGGTPGVDGECAQCRRNRLSLQPKATKQAPPVVVHEALNSPGRPLDANTRAFMEPRFGHNFGQVRVHTDEKAAEESARAVGALAYTVGTEVVFGAGYYAPETREGRRLLAHELAHVVQQAGSPGPINMMPATVITAGDEPLEREAQGAAARIDASQNVSVSAGHPVPGLQRQAGPTDDCSGWEQDPESFSIHVARFVARTQINPILGRDIPSVDCVDPRECRVTLSNGLTITVMWNPAIRRTLAKWETEQEYKRYLYEYSCPGGQLTLKFLLSRNTGKTPPSASGEQEGP